ncbi:MAG: Matrixin [Thermoleophilaceae bacterium]|nr:Matrixin [Thermoleophilaceae bacterium]
MRSRLFLVAVVVTLVVPSAARATTYPQYYGSPKITYYERDKDFSAAVAEGARMWNALGTPIKLTRVRSMARADIRVKVEPTLHVPGKDVSGLGGPGIVFLSREELRTAATVQVAHTVAHEFGHALGLPHLKGCAVMTSEGSASVLDCGSSDADHFPCGPQATDVRALAKIWHFKPKFTAQNGLCKFVEPKVELTADNENEAQRSGPIPPLHMYVRNLGTRPLYNELVAVPVDEAGEYRANGCVEPDESGGWIGFETDNLKPAKKGQVLDFAIYDFCPKQDEAKTYRFRLSSKWFKGPHVFGPIWTVTVRR